jgi:hypothetical protein
MFNGILDSGSAQRPPKPIRSTNYSGLTGSVSDSNFSGVRSLGHS